MFDDRIEQIIKYTYQIQNKIKNLFLKKLYLFVIEIIKNIIPDKLAKLPLIKGLNKKIGIKQTDSKSSKSNFLNIFSKLNFNFYLFYL